ncbi:unnamed protein product [Rotaria sp. Silwood2]|nr:unnamed protein product [Rotaria sp. Silwood2]CAF4200743.1 unnamed protein product [Rotaria sp. Silwood2]CAF4577642.1 unnamed protein product [Rotaria sp. Silwood2]
MASVFETIHSNKEPTYRFRFDNSDKHVHLTQQQLDRIPYLSALVTNKNDFLLIQNHNNEYILKPPINYTSFMIILHSVTFEQPYILFNELPEDENILETFQLLHYLDMNSFPTPRLRDKYSFLSSHFASYFEPSHVKYHQVKNISEARDTAAEFIIALNDKKYDLHDFNKVERVFSLLMIIFSNANIFSSRFRHHTLTVVNECCLSSFSEKQQLQLPTLEQIAQNKAIDSWVYLHNNDQPVPENFENTFAWRGSYQSIKENDTKDLSSLNILIIGRKRTGKYSIIQLLKQPMEYKETYTSMDHYLYSVISPTLERDHQHYYLSTHLHGGLSLISDDKSRYMNEAKSARSGLFNTLPKRPKVDKFKNRFGPKDKKYR